MPAEKRIDVRATPEQIAEIDRRAEAAGLTRSAFVLDRALSNSIPPARARQRTGVPDVSAPDPSHRHSKNCREALPYATRCKVTGKIIR